MLVTPLGTGIIFAAIGAPGLYTLSVSISKRWSQWPVLLTVWASAVSVLLWSFDVVRPSAGILEIFVDPYFWLALGLIIGLGNIGLMAGGKPGVYIAIIAAGVGSYLLFWGLFPATAGWAYEPIIRSRWEELVELTGWVWIAGIGSYIVASRWGRAGKVMAVTVMLFAAAVTYLGWLTWYQVEWQVIVAYSFLWLLAIYTMFSVALLMIVPVWRPAWSSVIVSAGVTVVISYLVYVIVIPELISSVTGAPVVLSGVWPF